LSITGPDSLAVSIGANAFQTLLFCPFLPQTLTCLFPGSNVTTAPPPCGSSAVTVSASSGGQTQPLTIESVSETLGDGEISSEIVVQNSGFCYNVTVQIPLTLTNFKISGGTITATQKAGSPQINGGVEFACDFFFSYLGILGVLTTGTLGAVLSVVVPKAVGTSIASINSAAPVSIPAGVGGVTVGGALTPDFVDVNVTPEAFTLIGGATLESIPPVPPQPGIALTQADTLSPLEIGSGTYSINACGSMNFPWIEYSQQVTAILQVVPIGITVGSVKWYVSTTDSPTMIETPVTGPSPLTVTVGCYFPDPVPSGITIQRTVSLNYSISSDGTQLTLQNFGLPNPADDPPNQGCFYLYVTVEVVDEAGNAWSASAWVAFVGDYSSIADIATSPATLCLDKLIGQALKSVAPAGWTEAQLAGVTSVYSHPSNPPDPYALAQAAGMVLALGGVVADKALVLGNIVQAQPLSQIFAAAAGSRQDVVAYTSTTVARES